MRRGRIEATVFSAVGKLANDASNVAVTAGVEIQAAAISAVSRRLPTTVSPVTA